MRGRASACWLLSVAAYCGVPSIGAPGSDTFENLTLETSYRAGAWSSDRQIGDPNASAIAQAWARFRGDIAPNLKITGEGRIELRLTNGASPTVRADVREAYLQWSSGPMRVRVGRQIFAWGRADRVNPTDAAASRDFSALVTTDEEQKRGQGAVRVDTDLGGISAQAYWIPEFRPDTIGLKSVEHVHTLSENWTDQFALRLEQSGGTVDWSVTYFEGLARTPQLETAPGPGGVERLYLQRKMLGADVATAIGGYTLRAEVARNWYDNGGNPIVSAGPEVFGVAGVDHDFGSQFYGNVQLIYAHSPDRARCPGPCASGLDTIIDTNNELSFTTHEDELGISALAAYHDEYETQRYELSAVYLTQDEGLLLRGRATFRVSDDVRVEVGGDYYTGDSRSVLGAQDDRTGGFAQVAFGF